MRASQMRRIMFEKELERARKSLLKELATTNPYVPLQTVVSNGGIHPSFRTFFGAEVAWWVHEERAIRTSNPRFDTADARLRELFAKLDEEYVRAARFDHEELTSIVDSAVKTRLNFLVRPRTTLKWFVFRGEPTKPMHEILLRLQFLSDHQYLTDGIRTWAQQRGATGAPSLEILSIIEFERIVEKIDNDAILDLSQDQFVRLLDPMFEFFAEYGSDFPPESLPTEAVIIFMDDKGAIPISQTLERMLYNEDLKIITRSKFLDVIDHVIDEIESGAIPGPGGVAETTEVELPPVDEPQAFGVEASTRKPPTDPIVESAYERRYARFEEEVDASMKAKMLTKLFDGETAKLEALLGDVLGCQTWKIAAATLDRWYLNNSIDSSKQIAMELAHALNRSFR